MPSTDKELTKENNDSPFESSVKAFMETLTHKAALTEEVRLAEEFNKSLIVAYKSTEILNITEAEEFAGSFDRIERLKDELSEVSQRHKDHENALSVNLQKIESKKVAYPFNGIVYELHFSTLKGVQCRELPNSNGYLQAVT